MKAESGQSSKVAHKKQRQIKLVGLVVALAFIFIIKVRQSTVTANVPQYSSKAYWIARMGNPDWPQYIVDVDIKARKEAAQIDTGNIGPSSLKVSDSLEGRVAALFGEGVPRGIDLGPYPIFTRVLNGGLPENNIGLNALSHSETYLVTQSGILINYNNHDDAQCMTGTARPLISLSGSIDGRATTFNFDTGISSFLIKYRHSMNMRHAMPVRVHFAHGTRTILEGHKFVRIELRILDGPSGLQYVGVGGIETQLLRRSWPRYARNISTKPFLGVPILRTVDVYVNNETNHACALAASSLRAQRPRSRAN